MRMQSPFSNFNGKALDSCNEHVPPHHRALQTFEKDGNFEYIIRRLVGHQQTPKWTLYRVGKYQYVSNDDTFEPESYIPAHFPASYSR